MPVLALFVAQCEECGRYAPRSSSPNPRVELRVSAFMGSTPHDAVANAVARGWRAYPVLCPQCTTNDEVADDQQDRGTLPEPGEGAERAERSRRGAPG